MHAKVPRRVPNRHGNGSPGDATAAPHAGRSPTPKRERSEEAIIPDATVPVHVQRETV